MNSLKAYQHDFSKLLQADLQGVAEPETSLQLQKLPGMQIYFANQVGILLHALQDSYPATHHLLGDDLFKLLANRFFEEFPCDLDSLDIWSLEFPTVLNAFHKAQSPAIPVYTDDLVRLERLIQKLELAPEAGLRSSFADFTSFLESLQQEQSESCQLQCNTTIGWLQSSYPIHKIYNVILADIQDSDSLSHPPLEKDNLLSNRIRQILEKYAEQTNPGPLLVARLNYEFYFKYISIPEWLLLLCLQEPCALNSFPDTKKWQQLGGDSSVLTAPFLQQFLKNAWTGNWLQMKIKDN